MAISSRSFSLSRRRHDATKVTKTSLWPETNNAHVLHGSLTSLIVRFFLIKTRPIPSNGTLVLTLDTTSCQGSETEVNYLEHVQAVISLNTTRRGEVEMFLTSPMGTR